MLPAQSIVGLLLVVSVLVNLLLVFILFLKKKKLKFLESELIEAEDKGTVSLSKLRDIEVFIKASPQLREAMKEVMLSFEDSPYISEEQWQWFWSLTKEG